MKNKIVVFLVAMFLCLACANPMVVKAEPITSNACTKSDEQKKNEEMFEKWNTLSNKQKKDIYKAIKSTLDAQAKFLDKLVKYEMLSKEDADMMKAEMYARYEEMVKNNALFPANPQEDSEQKNQMTPVPSKVPTPSN